MTQVLVGMTAAGCLVIAMFFFRFWQKSRDRFFALFSLAFLMMAVNRLILGALSVESEHRHGVYAIRLVAFLLILAAIVDKNRAER
jgi:hypothetical protein